MTLGRGTRLGPYEMLGLLGAGGMGEVYRARDPRLGREVAVKVLPASFAANSERLQRFEQEARAAGQLNHPNVLVLHDVGVEGGTPYLVTELLEGMNLRDAIAGGPLPPRRAVEYALQVSQGLAAAHSKGIVHRDLKPENLFVTSDGRIKILDFGLAKLTRAEGSAAEETSPVQYAVTEAGEILGTVSYMAPEQVRGRPADHRCDLFALGAILHEMLTGERAFGGETPADRMSAILHGEVAALREDVAAAVPGAELVIGRCLEKRAEARLDSARDLALALELVLRAAAGSKRGGGAAVEIEGAPAELQVRRLTFREGIITGARFAPDGGTVIYSAIWEGRPSELYQARVGSPESRSVGISDATLLAISPTEEMAILIQPRDFGGFISLGTLARVPVVGGVPRVLLENVFQADWSPDGRSLAIIRQVEGAWRLEYPIGKVLYSAPGWISHPRVSPDGTRVAFCDHPTRGDNSGRLAVVDAQGRVRHLAQSSTIVWGLAWAPGGDEVWFTSERARGSPGISAVTLEGSVRIVHQSTAFLYLTDLSRAGGALVMNVFPRMRLEFRAKGAAETTELSWLDWSLARDLTPDGRTVLFDETGPGGGLAQSVYVRDTDGSPAVRLGDGTAMRFSPDGQWVLASGTTRGADLVLMPIGVGQEVRLSLGDIHVHYAHWFPDGKSLCVLGYEPGRKHRLYRYDLERRIARPFTEEGAGSFFNVSPDGRFVPFLVPSGAHALYPVEDGEPVPLPSIQPNERPVSWTPDSSGLYVFGRNQVPAPVHLVDVATGRREQRLAITPRQRSGVTGLNSVCLAADGETYATSYIQTLGELYAVAGLR